MKKGQLESHILVLVTLGLTAFGLVMVYSATSAPAALGGGDPGFYLKRQAEERVAGLPLQEVGRIAVGQRGRGRRRAVDHHEPERGQSQRDEDEDVRVELAALQPATSATSRLKASPRSSKS